MTFAEFAFLADENIHPDVLSFVRDCGFDVLGVKDLGLSGASDRVVLQESLKTRRLVLTHDRDFGSLAIAAGQPIHGIVYLRPGHIKPEYTIQTLRSLFASALVLNPPFLVVAVRTERHIRIRMRRL